MLMRIKTALLPVVFACLATSALGVTTLSAQSPAASHRPAFYIAEFELKDPEGIRPYSAQVASTFEPFGGRFIVRGAEALGLEGEKPRGRLVVIAFDTMERAQAWYNSAAYQEVRPIRHRSGNSRTFIVEGIAN
jgi:uncharacterized protein (DUF1330 family)